MGQRHQVYVITKEENVLGIHHQWCYGVTAPRLLANLLEYHRKAGRNSVFNRDVFKTDALNTLRAAYSFDHTSGYQHNVLTLDQELKDPTLGDNNDGITLIDFRGKKPRYCFMSIGGDSTMDNLPHHVPMSAEQYIRAYYNEKEYAENQYKAMQIKWVERAAKREIKRLSKYELLDSATIVKVWPTLAPKMLLEVAS